MLQDVKRDLLLQASKLTKPYEAYSIDELADAYCEAVDKNDAVLKNTYISALILRFWCKIDKMYSSNSVAPCLKREDFFDWLYEGIEYACKYRGWQDQDKKLNAQQCINQCIHTISLQKYYNLRLDKNKAVNNSYSLDTPIASNGEEGKTFADILESPDDIGDSSTYDAELLVQSYINKNKIIEAIIIDTIAFNDTQKHHKKTIKTKNEAGEDVKYTEHSSEFWAYRLVQIVSKLPADYKSYFLSKYKISEDKLSAVLEVINRANNQKIYRYLGQTLKELRATYAY